MNYHVSNDELTAGTILYPRYGEMVQDPGFYRISDHNYAQYLKEMIFEDFRSVHHPKKPSRLNSIYLIEKLENAKKYKEKFNKKYIYEINLEESSNILSADMRWMDLSNRIPIEELFKVIDYYFNGIPSYNEDEVFWETLYDGPVKIIKKVE